MARLLPPVLCLGLTGLIAIAAADEPQPAVDPRVELARKLPGEVQPEELTPTGIPGLYELARGMEIGYVSEDGRYFISDGDLIDLHTRTSLTEQTRQRARRDLLASVPEDEMVVFAPESPRHTIIVFTNLECAACRQFHADVGELNKMGIEVRYLFWPFEGVESESWQKAVNVWCAKDRREAFARAMRGEPVPPAHCDATVIARHFALAGQLRLPGTPTVIAADGRLLAEARYLPPEQVLELLRQGQAEPSAPDT